MDEQRFYYDVSYQRTAQGPTGLIYRPNMDGVIDWLKENEGRLHFVIILRMPGNSDGLQDSEV